jgi:hypothetical protein
MMTLIGAAVLSSGAIASPSPTMAQSQGGPEELWEAYPLDEPEDSRTPAPTPASGGGEPPSLIEPADATDDGRTRWSLSVLLLGALAAFCVGLGLPLLRRDGPLPQPGPMTASRAGTRVARKRRFAPESDEQVRCQILLRTTAGEGRFEAIGFPQDESAWLTDSRAFRLAPDGRAERAGEALAAHRELVEQLEAHGWAWAGSGDEWYQDEFQLKERVGV